MRHACHATGSRGFGSNAWKLLKALAKPFHFSVLAPFGATKDNEVQAFQILLLDLKTLLNYHAKISSGYGEMVS